MSDYDRVPYDPAIIDALDPPRLFAFARQPGAPGVLDLGCGRGGQLARVAPLTTGPLLGIDLSADACAAARARLGDRGTIRCADLLDVAPPGTFGVVYHIGTHYLLPEPVQRHALDLIGACVAPGGVAVISYYAGPIAILRASLHRAVRATVEPTVAAARARLSEIHAALDRTSPIARAIEDTCAKNDTIFFHEVLGPHFDAITTSVLEAALARHGLAFFGYLDGPPLDAPTSSARAFSADLHDYAHSGYRHAIFLKPEA